MSNKPKRHQCKSCGNDLVISGSAFESELDSTKVYCKQDMVCTNANCSNFGGTDMKKPKKVAHVVKTKVN